MCMYILNEYSVHYTLRENTNVKKIIFGENKRFKRCSLFFSPAPTHHSFTFNLRFLYELTHMVCLSNTMCWIFHFDSLSFLLKFIFLSNKMHGLFDFKTS